jgi:hypothetical protein
MLAMNVSTRCCWASVCASSHACASTCFTVGKRVLVQDLSRGEVTQLATRMLKATNDAPTSSQAAAAADTAWMRRARELDIPPILHR